MSKELTVHFNDGEQETKHFPDGLKDIPWPKYQKLERKIKMNAELDRNGEIKELTVEDEKMGDFFVDIQEQMAKMILETENIDINDVTTRTVKKIIQEYGNDMEEFGMKLKKKEGKISDLVDLWEKGHAPTVNDTEIEEAIKTLNLLDEGVNIPARNIPAWEMKIMALVKSKMNKKQQKNMVEAQYG